MARAKTSAFTTPLFNMSDGSRRGGMREDARWKSGVPPVGKANVACCSIQHSTFGLRTSPRLAPTGIVGFVLADGTMSPTNPAKARYAKPSSKPI